MNEPSGIVEVDSKKKLDPVPYIYVVAFYMNEEDEDNQGPISFEHYFIMAQDDDDAYTKGYEAMSTETLNRGLLNDYVIKLEGK